MIVTVSLSDDEVESLEKVASREGRSLEAVARAAILEYVVGWGRERDRLIEIILAEDAKLLRRLGVGMTRYLEVEDVQQIIDRLGGRAPELRDPGLLVAALARPRAHFEGSEAYPSLALKAAALLLSLASLESLTNNNLRVAWVATRVFCSANGAPVAGPEDAAVEAVRSAAVGAITLEALAQLLAAWMTPQVVLS